MMSKIRNIILTILVNMALAALIINCGGPENTIPGQTTYFENPTTSTSTPTPTTPSTTIFTLPEVKDLNFGFTGNEQNDKEMKAAFAGFMDQLSKQAEAIGTLFDRNVNGKNLPQKSVPDADGLDAIDWIKRAEYAGNNSIASYIFGKNITNAKWAAGVLVNDEYRGLKFIIGQITILFQNEEDKTRFNNLMKVYQEACYLGQRGNWWDKEWKSHSNYKYNSLEVKAEREEALFADATGLKIADGSVEEVKNGAKSALYTSMLNANIPYYDKLLQQVEDSNQFGGIVDSYRYGSGERWLEGIDRSQTNQNKLSQPTINATTTTTTNLQWTK